MKVGKGRFSSGYGASTPIFAHYRQGFWCSIGWIVGCWAKRFRTLETTALSQTRYTTPMIRRWIIRGVALTLLTFVVALWLTSYFAELSLFRRINGLSSELFASHGSFYCFHESRAHSQGNPLFQSTFPDDPLHLSILSQSNPGIRRPNYGPTTFGFRYGNVPALVGIMDATIVIMPLWFPTLLSALVLWFVWRKTRAKPIGGAFPVEVTAKAK